MPLPLEDSFSDIVGKAQRGLSIADSELASRVGVDPAQLRAIHDGDFDEKVARAVAPILGLNAEALVASGKKSWQPVPAEKMEGFADFTTPFDDMLVNAYVAWDPRSREAVAFDTGSDCAGMLDLFRSERLALKLILLTHTHGDHIYDLDRLKSKTAAPVFVSAREPFDGARTFEPGKIFDVGDLRIEARLTWGHSAGGMTYFVTGLAKPLAIVGDAIFAGSMGGGMVSYEAALKTNREGILTLPNETIICPGHGPMTTVAEEKRHNPFFA